MARAAPARGRRPVRHRVDAAIPRGRGDLARRTSMKTVDALIVGAGPAGSAAAIGLARRGYEVALLDKQVFPREKLCGDFLNPVNRAMFRELGVEEQLLRQPHGKVSIFRLTSSYGGQA